MEAPATLTPELIVNAYAAGAFPMARSRASTRVDWYSPDPRAVLPLDALHVRRSLRKALRRDVFELRLDTAFDRVVAGCAAPRPRKSAGGLGDTGEPGDEEETWISPMIERVFRELHMLGLAHSIEAWREDQLVGGLYGLALGGAFFAESMFSRRPCASQACLVHLVMHLRAQGFTLLDVQFTNPHLQQFGVIEVPRDHYMRELDAALRLDVRFA